MAKARFVSRAALLPIVTASAAFLASGGLAWAQPQDANFTQTTYASGVGSITDLAWASDGANSYLFFTQQGGAIRVVRNGTLQGGSVTTVSPVLNSGEMGLLGICADPAFATNRRIYVFATVNSGTQRIFRYTTTDSGGTVGVSGGATQLGPDLPCMGVNHDGGSIAFGPDGNLYFGVGNLGNGNNVGGDATVNEFNTLGSKVGRMTAAGGSLSTNPWYTGGGGARDYMWSRGWRNPFGIAFRPGTNDPWVLEVGDSWEHIFLAPSGSNRGWPTENNTSTVNGKLIPRFAYQRNSGPSWAASGGCITRGCFYTGTAFPSQYQGNLFFTEYNGGKLVRVIPNGTGTIPSSNVSLFVNSVSGIVDVEGGPDGALYYASRGNSAIYRLYYSGTTSQNIIVSRTSMTINEGGTGTFTVRLAADPGASGRTVNVARSSGDSDITVQSGATLNFTSGNWSTPQTVTIAAAQDADTTNDSATITCSSTGLASQNVAVTATDDDTGTGAPTSTITQPLQGATISGTTAEFYGDGMDDVAPVRAEFYVDNVLMYTDTTAPTGNRGHYHVNGGHSRFNTTRWQNGPHTLAMVVFDGNGLSARHEINVTIDNSAGAGGLVGEYYDNMDLTGLAMVQVDPTVNANWGTGSPDPTMGVDSFSVRWTGQITPTYSETYTFYTTTDDGVRLWVNGVLIIDHWVNQGPTTWTGTIALTAGVPASVQMEYYENGGGAVAQLEWSSPSQVRGTIPSSAFTNGFTGNPPASGGGSSGDDDCGALGLEALLAVGLLRLLRRRR